MAEKIEMGANGLTKVIEEIMKKYGGDKYKSVNANTLRNEIIEQLNDVDLGEAASMVKFRVNLIKKIKKAKTVEDILLEINEAYFFFFENNE